MKNFSNNILMTPLTLSGGTTSEFLDMKDFEGCVFLVLFSSGHASNKIEAKQDADGSGAGTALAAAAACTPGAAITSAWLDVYKPTKRYLQMVATLGAGSVSAAYALQYNCHDAPVDNDRAAVITGTLSHSPDEA